MLTLAIRTSSGIDLPEAVIVVESTNSVFNQNISTVTDQETSSIDTTESNYKNVTYSAAIYRDLSAYQSEKLPAVEKLDQDPANADIDSFSFKFDEIEGSTATEKAYNHLKAKPRFSSAVVVDGVSI